MRNGLILHHKSCEDLGDLRDDLVALTVTSPPYWNSVDYDRHAQDPNQWYRTRQYRSAGGSYDAYLDWLEGIFTRLLPKTRPGGFCAIVIGTVLLEGRHYPVPFDLTSRLVRKGWQFHQDILWHKVTGGVKRAGTFIQKPYPGYFYPNQMTEYILLFRRPGPPIYSGRTREEKQAALVEVDRLFTLDVAHNLWNIPPVPPGHLEHPCPFPEEIPYRLIRLYSYPGDVVLDPFAGSGQTLKVALALGRQAIGYETVGKYVEYALRRVQEPLHLRSMQIVARFEKVPLGAPRMNVPRRTPSRKQDGQSRDLGQRNLFDERPT
ncbi:site-specific DNA-methyltransferase [Myxococcota bacterium]|nr:site-specific DNA-methyltransferase [Myxococcota bacterium]